MPRSLKSALFGAIVLCVALLFVFALRQDSAPVNGAVSPDDFLSEVRVLQAQNTAGEEADAALPPIGTNQDALPAIELETDSVDLGKIPNNEITKKQVLVRNTGKTPLSISDITSTCACTIGIVPEDSKTIAPGGEGHIEVAVNPSKVRGFSSTKVLTIFSNDPKNSRLALAVSATLDPEFILEPETVDFATVQKGQKLEQTIRIRQNTDEEFEVKEATLMRPGERTIPLRDFGVSLKAVPEAEWREAGKKEYEITLTMDENIPLGKLLRYFYITTNLRRIPFHAYKIEGIVESFYTLDPSIPNAVTMLRPVGSLESVTAAATLRANTPIKLDSFEFDRNFLEVKLRQGATAGTAHIDITLKPVAAGELDKRVDFKVHGDGKTVQESIAVKILGSGHQPRGL